MRHLPALLALFLISPLALASGQAEDGPVRVAFDKPETFTDARYDGRSRRSDKENPVLDDMADYLRKQAPRHLAPGQHLFVRFTDIDLAGDVEPTTRLDLIDVRIVKTIYPPRLQFSWELRDAEGNLVRHGDERLKDLAFDRGSTTLGNHRLRYEQRMLRRWLSATFGAPPRK